MDVIETGTMRERELGHCWIWKNVTGRHDNALCVAVLVGDAIIVKTVMNHFAPEGT